MLPSGLQMLPLLWLLLWMPKLGLSSPQSLWDMFTSSEREHRHALYNRGRDGVGETVGVQPEGLCKESIAEEEEQDDEYYPTVVKYVKMLCSNDAIYTQFQNTQHSSHLVFNATELRRTVPDPSSLARAELKLHLPKHDVGQVVLLFEKYGTKAWRSIQSWVLHASNSEEWISLDVTGVVCQWLRHRGEIEVLRLTALRDVGNKDSVLHIKIDGINPTCHADFPGHCEICVNQPFLRLGTYPLDQSTHVNSSQYPGVFFINCCIRALDKVTRVNNEDSKTVGDFYEDVVTRASMLDINNEVYKQFRTRRRNVFMAFNKTELRKAVPNPSLLSRAELHLLRRKQHQEQTLMLYERTRNGLWNNLRNHLLVHNDTKNWLWFDVTEAVRRWLNQEEPIEALRLKFINMGEVVKSDPVVDIRGLTPSSDSDQPDIDTKNRPFLVLLTSRLKPMNSSQHS